MRLFISLLKECVWKEVPSVLKLKREKVLQRLAENVDILRQILLRHLRNI